MITNLGSDGGEAVTQVHQRSKPMLVIILALPIYLGMVGPGLSESHPQGSASLFYLTNDQCHLQLFVSGGLTSSFTFQPKQKP